MVEGCKAFLCADASRLAVLPARRRNTQKGKFILAANPWDSAIRVVLPLVCLPGIDMIGNLRDRFIVYSQIE